MLYLKKRAHFALPFLEKAACFLQCVHFPEKLRGIVSGREENRGFPFMLHCFHQTLTNDTFSQEMEVTFPDCDPSRQAKLSTLLGFAVAAASAD